MTPKEELISLIVLSQTPGIGPVLGKTLIRYFGTAKAAIDCSKSEFLNSPVANEKIHQQLIEKKSRLLEFAEAEWEFCERYNIKLLSFFGDEYPLRLKQLIDAPLLLFYKGNADLNPERTIAVVGTRKPKKESLELTNQIIEELSYLGVQVISGLAYGIDIAAHRSALSNQLPTIGVLAHGLDTIYPTNHRNTAQEMVNSNSGLLTEMLHNTKLHPDLFPRRNRIVAGLSDAVLVVESKNTGGSMATAQIARSYDREVFAIPGSPFYGYNTGTNALIKRNVAYLIESANDIIQWMKWPKIENTQIVGKDSTHIGNSANFGRQHDSPALNPANNVQNTDNKMQTTSNYRHHESESNLSLSRLSHPPKLQKTLFENASPVELEILNLLANQSKHIDELLILSQIPLHQLTLSLLELELKGVIKTMPGKYYSRA
jgi:DNA processing protein